MAVTLFGIRHHGPGSAKSLLKALDSIKPDCILIEGPPEADEIINLANASNEKMVPPIAILVYLPDEPKKAVIYPFAVFSPEWQAIQFGLKNNIHTCFMDLPQYYQLGKEEKKEDLEEEIKADEVSKKQREDPIGALAKVAGYSDGEVWWDNFVENRTNDLDMFQAINEMMTALRKELNQPLEKRETLREAYMRKTIRKAKKDGFKNIAVICGAWHVPALEENVSSAKEDDALIKELKKVKTQATWIPWTHSRLSYYTGYGAGIESPGWYHHLWTTKQDISINWMAKVAELLREKDLAISSAHIIEAVRLAETLAIIRNKNLIGLAELNDATQAVLSNGSSLPLKLIHDNLIVGSKLGEVPHNVPMTPIQQNFLEIIKNLRLKTELNIKEVDLDLRKEIDLEKSYLFHRLNILGINWGKIKRASGKKGTFHEIWDLEWKPEFSVQMIESGMWGNTIYDAVNAYAISRTKDSKSLEELTSLLEVALLSNIPEALENIMKKLENEASLSSDTEQLMLAIPPLASVLRYGNVRKTDSEMVKKVLDGLVIRVCIGLPNTCISMNYDSSVLILEKIVKFNDSLKLLQNEEYLDSWYKTLIQISESANINGLISGYACRLLFDNDKFDLDAIETKMSLVLSINAEISKASEWLEGFLRGSGLLLIHNEQLLFLIDNWLKRISNEDFVSLLPIMRRNFSEFANAEKRQIGELVKNTDSANKVISEKDLLANFSRERAMNVLPVLKSLLGVKV